VCQTGRLWGIEVCGKRKPWSNASYKAVKDILQIILKSRLKIAVNLIISV